MNSSEPQRIPNPAVPTGLCPHFGECGGCKTQNLAYDEQLVRKEAALRAVFADVWDGSIPVAPSPVRYHYRNKVDFNFALKRYEEKPPPGFQRETVLGFNKPGKWYWPLDILECRIGPEGSDALLDSVRRWYQDQGLQAYDSRTGEGLLRVLLFRRAKRTGQAMVVLITADGELDEAAFVAAVQAAVPAVSVYRGIFRGRAQGAFADELHLLEGERAIEEELKLETSDGERRLRFRISPFSFFQTNTLGTEVLYRHVRTWVAERGARVLYDLYGGMGGIAFSCADLVDIVRSVESAPEATADGEANASLNGIDNVFFSTSKMKNYLLNLSNTGGMEPTAVAVVDPPRAGMHPKARKRLVECAPRRFLYVSCKPEVLAQEMPQFLQRYRLESLRAVDLFPHTQHVEALASFVRR